MKKILLISILSLFLHANAGKPFKLHLTPQQLDSIGKQIWHNEGRQKIEMLTCWNQGEDCASMGIGHFIWYPKKHASQFKQTFPQLIVFLQNNGIKIPKWLSVNKAAYCPWYNREAFYKQMQSARMRELRTLLHKTVALQTTFIYTQAQNQLITTLAKLPMRQRRIIQCYLNKLCATPQGVYIIIDYINFKGIGFSPNKSYKNLSWGLIDVLHNINKKEADRDISAAFILSAEQLLKKRIHQAPKNRDEARWLPGWKKRLATYQTFTYADQSKK